MDPNGERLPAFREKLSVCAVLTGINTAVFLLGFFSDRLDRLFFTAGCMDVPRIIGQGEYYRVVTACFLHAGIDHLASNMLILYFLGIHVEKVLGHGKFLILYLLSGISGNLFSMSRQLQSGMYYHSIGASGAVFGIVGAYLLLALINRKYIGNRELKRIAFGVFFSLYIGFRSEGTDNAAHVGGFAAGFLLMLLYSFAVGHKKEERII